MSGRDYRQPHQNDGVRKAKYWDTPCQHHISKRFILISQGLIALQIVSHMLDKKHISVAAAIEIWMKHRLEGHVDRKRGMMLKKNDTI